MLRVLLSSLVCAILVLAPPTAPMQAQDAEPAEAAESSAEAVTERGIANDVGNCLAKGMGAAKCLENLMKKATRDAKKPLNAEIKKLQANATKAQQDLEKARKDLEKQAGAAVAKLQSETLLLSSATKLNLEPLVKCLAESPNDLGRLINDFGNDPTAFAQAEINALLKISKRHVDKLMKRQIASLSKGRPSQNIDSLIDQADRLFAELASQRPASKCAFDAIKPMRQQAKATAKSILPALEKQVNTIVKRQIEPAIGSAISSQLAPVLAQVTGIKMPPKKAPKKTEGKAKKKQEAKKKPSADRSRREQAVRKSLESRKRIDRSQKKVKRTVKRRVRTRGVESEVEEEILVYPDEPSEATYRSVGLAPPMRIVEDDPDDQEEIPWIEIDEPVLERSVEPDPVWVSERGISDLVPDKKEIEKIARGVAAKHLLNPKQIERVAAQVSLLAKSLDDPTKKTQAATAVNAALDPAEVWTEEILLEIGVEILRHTGHKYIESDELGGGDFFVTAGLAVVNELETTIMNVVEGACGLIPEVGGIISGVVIEVIDTVYELANAPATKIAIIKAMHLGFDQALDAAHKAMEQNHDPARFRERAGPLGAMLDAFPTKEAIVFMAGDQVKDVQEALFAYHASVRQLSNAAAAAN